MIITSGQPRRLFRWSIITKHFSTGSSCGSEYGAIEAAIEASKGQEATVTFESPSGTKVYGLIRNNELIS